MTLLPPLLAGIGAIKKSVVNGFAIGENDNTQIQIALRNQNEASCVPCGFSEDRMTLSENFSNVTTVSY